MENKMEQQHKRRVRYKGTHPRNFHEKYKELNPEIVTMDITMPVLNGIEALDLIKLHDKDAKVVMVTAAGQQMKMMEALKKGAVDFVQKPFEPEKIISIIDKVAKQ